MPPIIISELHSIPIVADAAGRIMRICIVEGSTVQVGDPLIQLDVSDVYRREQAIESRIHFAELNTAGARSDLLSLYRELESAQLELNRLTITSPVAGRIWWLAMLSPGEMLFAGTAVAVVR